MKCKASHALKRLKVVARIFIAQKQRQLPSETLSRITLYFTSN